MPSWLRWVGCYIIQHLWSAGLGLLLRGELYTRDSQRPQLAYDCVRLLALIFSVALGVLCVLDLRFQHPSADCVNNAPNIRFLSMVRCFARSWACWSQQEKRNHLPKSAL